MASAICRNVFGGADDALRLFQPQQARVLKEGFGIDRRVVADGLFLRAGVADDLVVHIGDIHDVV